jgi:hypothetical protein
MLVYPRVSSACRRANALSARGAIIMSFFGSLFATLTLLWEWKLSGPILALPFATFLLIAALALHVLKMPGPGYELSKAAKKAVVWSSIAEGVGFFLVSQVLLNIHRLDLLLPGMALVVGLHFLPIAHASRFSGYFVLGIALIVAAAAGALIGPGGGQLAGFAAALALSIASIAAIRRDLKSKQASGAVS